MLCCNKFACLCTAAIKKLCIACHCSKEGSMFSVYCNKKRAIPPLNQSQPQGDGRRAPPSDKVTSLAKRSSNSFLHTALLFTQSNVLQRLGLPLPKVCRSIAIVLLL